MGVVCVAALALAAAGTAAAAGSPEQQLADRYAPVVRLVAQDKPCAHGEPYEPSDVNLVLGSPDVALRGPWAGAIWSRSRRPRPTSSRA